MAQFPPVDRVAGAGRPGCEIGFAWGPASDKMLRHADGVELVVARNRDGGAGSIAVDDIRIVALPGEPVAATAKDDPNAALMSKLAFIRAEV